MIRIFVCLVVLSLSVKLNCVSVVPSVNGLVFCSVSCVSIICLMLSCVICISSGLVLSSVSCISCIISGCEIVSTVYHSLFDVKLCYLCQLYQQWSRLFDVKECKLSIRLVLSNVRCIK